MPQLSSIIIMSHSNCMFTTALNNAPQTWYEKTPLGKKRAKAAKGDDDDGGGKKGKGKKGKGKKTN